MAEVIMPKMSDAMMELGWVKAAGTLVCKHGGEPEGGYRRSIADSLELDVAGADVDGSPDLRQQA